MVRRASIKGPDFDRNLLMQKGATNYRADKVKAGKMSPGINDPKAVKVNGRALGLYSKLRQGPVKALGTNIEHPEWGTMWVDIKNIEKVSEDGVVIRLDCREGKFWYDRPREVFESWNLTYPV